MVLAQSGHHHASTTSSTVRSVTCHACKGVGHGYCRACRGVDQTTFSCGSCRGVDQTLMSCSTCRGRRTMHDGACNACSGTGRRAPCTTCRGTGHRPACGSCHGSPDRAVCRPCGGDGKLNVVAPRPRIQPVEPVKEAVVIYGDGHYQGRCGCCSVQPRRRQSPVCDTPRPSGVAIKIQSGDTTVVYSRNTQVRQRSYRSSSYHYQPTQKPTQKPASSIYGRSWYHSR